MGKMKQIAELIRTNDVDLLRRLIKASQAINRPEVSFLGTTYTIEEANNILSFMYEEQTKHNKIYWDKQSVKSDANNNN